MPGVVSDDSGHFCFQGFEETRQFQGVVRIANRVVASGKVREGQTGTGSGDACMI